jgi:hypothetical protein
MAVKDVLMIGVLIFTFAIGFFIFHNISNTVINQMLTNPQINSSNATVNVLQGTQRVTARMDYVIFGLFIGLIIALILTSWFIGGNPIFMFIYFIVLVFGIVTSVVLSNVWEEVSTKAIFGTTINAFPITNHLMTYLPIYSAIIGIVGLVIMFAKPALAGNAGEF